MFTPHDLLIARAAFLFWREETCPYGGEFVRPYVDVPENKLLPREEIARLRKDLQGTLVRYVLYSPVCQHILADKLFPSLEAARKACEPPLIPVIILIPIGGHA